MSTRSPWFVDNQETMLTIGPLHDEIYSFYHGNTNTNSSSSSSMVPYVLVRNRSSVYLFPDNETFLSLLGTTQNLLWILPLPTQLTATTNLQLDNNLTQYQYIPSLKTTIWSTPDDVLFALIAKILFLNPVSLYIDDGPHFVPGLTNGAIVRVPRFSNTSYFASWLGKGIWKWYDVKTLTGIRFGSIDHDRAGNYTVFGSPDWRMTDGWNTKVYNQQEARLLLLPDGLSVFVICTARFHNGPFQQMYGIMELNETSLQWELGLGNAVVWLDYQRQSHIKNLVPFLYNNTVHLIPSFFPLIVLQVLFRLFCPMHAVTLQPSLHPYTPHTHVPYPSILLRPYPKPILFFPLVILQTLPPTPRPHNGPVLVIYHEFKPELAYNSNHSHNHHHNTTTTNTTTYSLPWDVEYGADIRGGTPALPVPGPDGTEEGMVTWPNSHVLDAIPLPLTPTYCLRPHSLHSPSQGGTICCFSTQKCTRRSMGCIITLWAR